MVGFAALSPFELAGLLTHLVVLAIGVGGLVGLVPLARGLRSGLGLVLMALAMAVLVAPPIWRFGEPAALGYVVAFAVALWLLIGPASPKSAGAGGE